MTGLIPDLSFIITPTQVRVFKAWVKHDPKYSQIIACEDKALSDLLKLSSDELVECIKDKRKDILSDMAEFSGFEWDKNIIDIFPTFLSPSLSSPLLLRVLDSDLQKRDVNLLVGILLHELAHNIIKRPKSLLENRKINEEITDQLTIKVLENNNFSSIEFKKFTFEKTFGEHPSVEQWQIPTNKLFNQTIRDYFLRKSSLRSGDQ